MAVNDSGSVYVTAYSTATWGTPVRAYSSGNDAFAARLAGNGSLTWNTFLGGTGDDQGVGIAVDGSGNVYVTGPSSVSWGTPVRTYSSSYDAFAAKLAGNGVLTWNTFLGGSGTDWGFGIIVGAAGVFLLLGAAPRTGVPPGSLIPGALTLWLPS